MVDIKRLRERMVLTTENPIRQPDETDRYPIYIVEEVSKDETDVFVIDSRENSRRVFDKKDLESMHLVESSLAHKDRLIRESRTAKKGTDNDSELFLLALAICQEAGESHKELAIYLKELSPGLLKTAKAFLQRTLERQTNVDLRAFAYKARRIPERKRT